MSRNNTFAIFSNCAFIHSTENPSFMTKNVFLVNKENLGNFKCLLELEGENFTKMTFLATKLFHLAIKTEKFNGY